MEEIVEIKNVGVRYHTWCVENKPNKGKGYPTGREGSLRISQWVEERGSWLWSSSEYSVNNAWNFNTNDRNVNNNNKNNCNNNNRVRAFCEFPYRIMIKEYTNGIPLSDVFDAYYECRKHKRRTASQIEFEVNLEANVIDLWKEINEETYEIGASICFCVTRPKLREVFAANFRDRVIHHVIMQRLEPLFEEAFIADTYNCRKGKGVLYGVNRLCEKLHTFTEGYTKEAYVAKFDICGFFMAIDKDILLNRLITFINERYLGNDKELLKRLCIKIIQHRPQENCIRHGDLTLWEILPPNKSLFTCKPNNGLPIGNLTSQNFGNFYLNEFDHLMREEFGEGYGRYVDDFFVINSDKEQILRFIPKIKAYLQDVLKLQLHHDKIYIQNARHGIKFIGSFIKRDRIYVGNTTLSNIYEKIQYFNKHIDAERAEEIMQTLNSYFGFMKHSKSYALQCGVLEMLNEQWWDFLTLDKNKNKVNIIP